MLAAPLAQVGGKARGLARLAALGMAVPPFVVVTSAAFEAYLSENGLAWPAAEAVLRRGTVPAAVLAVLAASVPWRVVAVRSSGADEDSADASFAGQFSSVLGVPSASVGGALTACWASSASARSLAYRAARRIPLGPAPAFGVVVQRQVVPRAGGVLFTRHPLPGHQAESYLEAVSGSGESVVGGTGTPDRVTYDRKNGAVAGVVASGERAVLSEEEVVGLFGLGLQVEAAFGCPQDIEWAVDADGIWLLQARPIPGALRG